MKIVLDFDDTILNTGELFDRTAKIFENIGFTKEDFVLNYNKSKEIVGEFNLEPIIDLLGEQKPFDKEKVRKEFNSIIDNANTLVYPDFFDFAKFFGKKDLILLSIARTDFQKVKIGKSGVVPYFSDIIITPVDKVVEMEIIHQQYRPEAILLVDDKADQIDKVKIKLSDVITMKIERAQGRHSGKRSELADYTIRNFIEAKNIINNIKKSLTL